MSKGRPRKKRKRRGEGRHPKPSAEVKRILERAERLIESGHAQEAVDLLLPLLASNPRAAEVHYMLGYARVNMGDLWNGIDGYERALELSHDPGYWPSLASIYLELGLSAHALDAFRQAVRHPKYIPLEMRDQIDVIIRMLEDQVKELSETWRIPFHRAKKGLYEMEEGTRALGKQDYTSCIAANRRACRLLGDWPPPHNNLSLALFYDGHPEEAISVARNVLAHAPINVQALSNVIRFLTWSGREQEARTLWDQLQAIEPADATDRFKIAVAAAILKEDEIVYRMLCPIDETDEASEVSSQMHQEVQFMLAVAEANTGRKGARRRLLRMRDRHQLADDCLAALGDGRSGLGWSQRYPYFDRDELVPWQAMEELVKLAGTVEEVSEQHLHQQMVHFAERFPQIVLVAEKMIWEEELVDVGLAILKLLNIPRAYAALRRFGTSQVGDDVMRMEALHHLVDVGEIEPDAGVRVWLDGAWQEILIRRIDVSDEYVSEYTAEVAELLNSGLNALKRDELAEAESLFLRALELEPHAKQAYNNLGVIYTRRGDIEKAKEVLGRALEIDPLYVVPRCNLAEFLLDDGEVEAAESMIDPLAEVIHFNPQDMAFYLFVQARVLLARGNYDGARDSLNTALEIKPDYELAQELLKSLRVSESISGLQETMDALMHKVRERENARRERLQAKLTTADPALSKALSQYTKDALTTMAHEVIPWGGWSGLRKAELVQEIAGVLMDAEILADIVDDLDDDARTALREVLEHGGAMPWNEFDERYGNDLDESPYFTRWERETSMGQLRLCGVLVEATVDGELLVVVPVELRTLLAG